MGEKTNAYRILVGKPEGNGALGRPRRRWENNIKMDLRDIGWVAMDWIDLAWDRGQLEGPCEYGNKPSGSIKCGCVTGGFSRRAQLHGVSQRVS
jgi:hypothetical protein